MNIQVKRAKSTALDIRCNRRRGATKDQKGPKKGLSGTEKDVYVWLFFYFSLKPIQF